MTAANNAGTGKKYFQATIALKTYATMKEATIGRTRKASLYAKDASCQSATAWTRRKPLIATPNPT